MFSRLVVRGAALSLVLGLASAVPALSQVTLRNVVLKANRNDYPPTSATGYSACWVYVHSDSSEYAAIGVGDQTAGGPEGTAIYNVSDPDNVYLVGFIPGPPSIWREMKSYRNWIYVVTEGTGAGQGVQIIRMTNPEAPVLAATYTGTFRSSHTVSIDTTRALLICNGTRNSGGNATGLRVLSLANPEAPVEIGSWPGTAPPVPDNQYVHDSVPIGNRLYASSIYAGTQRVLDFTNPAAVTQIASWAYPGGFTHNSWPDATGQFLYVTDEINGEPLKIFDISNLGAPVLANGITSNPQAIVHNAHVKGSELYLANYTEGIRILDLADPRHPAEFGYADSYPGPSGFYDGVWEVCPFLPSGRVIASDRQTGLYLYEVQRNYGLLRVRVEIAGTTTAGTCAVDGSGCCCAPGPCHCGGHEMAAGPAAGVEVFLTTQAESLTTTTDGVVVFAANPGTATVKAELYGYYDATATRTITNGVPDSVVLTLTPRPTNSFAGTVRNATTQAALEGAEVNLVSTPVHLHTNAAGAFSDPAIPEDEYAVQVQRPGFAPLSFTRTIGPGPVTQDFQLTPAALWDPLESATAWIVGQAGDGATEGIWTRVEPLGTGVPLVGANGAMPNGIRKPFEFDLFHEDHTEDEGVDPGEVQPEFDRTPPPGTLCFVTGQGTDPNNVGQADVEGGPTTLRTPLLNAAAMTTPTIGYWFWFYSSGDYFDFLEVRITNNDGATWVPVDIHRGTHNHNHWTERTIRIADYVPPTNQMRLLFQAADFGAMTVVEAAIDDLVLYDASAPQVGTPPGSLPTRVAFRAPWPNPSRGEVSFALDLPAAGLVQVEVLDLQGRRVRSLFDGRSEPGSLALRWNGADDRGLAAPAGLYYVRARSDQGEAVTRFVRMN